MTETVDGAQHFYEAQSENEFMGHVIAYAKARGWLVFHTHIAKRSAEGFPDLTMVRGTVLVFAELKREKGGRVSPAQTAWLAALNVVAAWCDGPVAAFLWRPSDWPTIETVLR